MADTWYELTPTAVLSSHDHYAGAAVWSASNSRMYVFGGINNGRVLILYIAEWTDASCLPDFLHYLRPSSDNRKHLAAQADDPFHHYLRLHQHLGRV